MYDFACFSLKNSFFVFFIFEIFKNEFKRGRENEMRAGDRKLTINFAWPNEMERGLSHSIILIFLLQILRFY